MNPVSPSERRALRVAVASGKGGTGKTMAAVSLALSLAREKQVAFFDCDVEAPNAHLFLRPVLDQKSEAVIRIPQIDAARCTACGKCAQVCAFHALALVGKRVMVFPQLCHGCGSCTWNCPEGAITEISNPIGTLESGLTEQGICFSQGVLTISEPMPTPMIRQLKHLPRAAQCDVEIYDSPPGASCSVVETLRGADFALLVTEPTPFGLHDLQQILGIARDMQIPAGVIINRQGAEPYPPLTAFCTDQNLPVLMRIPFDRQIAEGLAAGKPLTDILPEYQHAFQLLYAWIDTQLAAKGEQYAAN